MYNYTPKKGSLLADARDNFRKAAVAGTLSLLAWSGGFYSFKSWANDQERKLVEQSQLKAEIPARKNEELDLKLVFALVGAVVGSVLTAGAVYKGRASYELREADKNLRHGYGHDAGPV